MHASALPGVHAFLASLDNQPQPDPPPSPQQPHAAAAHKNANGPNDDPEAAAEAARPCSGVVLPRGRSALECAPTFVLVGAQKAATTSLFGYLGQHPSVALPHAKELNFLG